LEINPYYSKYEVEYQGYNQERSGLNLRWKVTPDSLTNWYVNTAVSKHKFEMENELNNNTIKDQREHGIYAVGY
jgi:hypothetical protein